MSKRATRELPDPIRVPLSRLFRRPLPVVGMVHLLPLPGSPRWAGSMKPVLQRAEADAAALVAGQLDGILIENYGDAPFFPDRVPPETVAALARIVATLVEACPVPVGVNVLRNDARAALAVAVAGGARFIRVNVHTGAMLTDQGWIRGRAHQTLRARAHLAPDVAILADVLVKHATAPPGLEPGIAAHDTWHRGLADGLIVSGVATGQPADPARIAAVRTAVPGAPLWIGSGLRAANAASLASAVDGIIAGSALQRHGVAGHPVDPRRVRTLMAAVAEIRATRTTPADD